MDPYNLYGRFAGLSGFLEGIAWQTEDLRAFEPAVETTRRGDLSISPTLGWAGRPAATRFTVAGGRLTGPSDVAGYLYGRRYNTQYRAAAPVTLQIDSAAPTSVAVTVAVAARSGAELVIEVDGRRALAVPFVPAAADIAVERAFRVDVPAGRHVVTIDNAGTDWLQIGGYAVGGAVPLIRPLGLIGSRPAAGGSNAPGKSIALVWLQDRQHTWANVYTGYQPALIDDARVALDGLIPGRYRYTWWDPWGAHSIDSGEAEVAVEGRLTLAAPPFRRDLALRITAEPGT